MIKDFSKVNVEVYDGKCEDGMKMIHGGVTSCNIIGFSVGTTGYCGGDSGHGGRTIFTIFDRLSSDMRATTYCDGSVLRVELGGDSELDTIIAVLKSIALILEASASKGTKCTDAKRIMELMKGNIEKPFEQRKVEALEYIAACLKTLVPTKG